MLKSAGEMSQQSLLALRELDGKEVSLSQSPFSIYKRPSLQCWRWEKIWLKLPGTKELKAGDKADTRML